MLQSRSASRTSIAKNHDSSAIHTTMSSERTSLPKVCVYITESGIQSFAGERRRRPITTISTICTPIHFSLKLNRSVSKSTEDSLAHFAQSYTVQSVTRFLTARSQLRFTASPWRPYAPIHATQSRSACQTFTHFTTQASNVAAIHQAFAGNETPEHSAQSRFGHELIVHSSKYAQVYADFAASKTKLSISSAESASTAISFPTECTKYCGRSVLKHRKC